ncbi:alpha/beta hydrolase [Leucobacter luti]|uniref:TAP-like protein n=1 Tax=Leucobacter luti TaxID=340320 RepID=A0A4Q7U4F7_9MICO|nr:alpha/beta hydrolase [Leucobacter luti]MBL3700607.1 alpha/beta hydrolase [Leucobacter luti]RZT68555.1 TAP-like protein [Leucobacter luti]
MLTAQRAKQAKRAKPAQRAGWPRAGRLIGGAIALALTLSSCASLQPGIPRSSEAPHTESVPKSLAAAHQKSDFPDVYAQQIDWRECTAADGLDAGLAGALDDVGVDTPAIRCGTVMAPFDWSDRKDADRIELAIVHIPSTGASPRGTLLGNPGGPGATGVDFMLGMPLSPDFGPVLADYDLLGFDPRGIGGSTPLNCDGAGSEIPAIQLGACVADNPIAHTMGTSQVARDMELLRSLMDAERLDYIGYSYGTMLGATYATIFPDQVGRMVLDSAENAEWASPIHHFDQAVAVANATVALATSCRTEYRDEVEVCPFVDEDSLLRVLGELNEDPLVASDGTRIDGDALQSYLTDTLYQSHYERGRALDRIALALFGDQDAIDEIGEMFAGEDGAIDLAMEVVTCHSFPIEPDIPGLLEHIRATGIPRLLGGPEISDDTLAPFVDLSCYALPESGLDITESFDAAEADPILVIGITGDHATPYQYAQELVTELGNATLLTLDGQGHAASYSDRSSCIDDAVTAYLVDGDLPKAGTICRDD